MNEQDKVTLKVEHVHTCGQVIEQNIHVSEADFSINVQHLPLLSDFKLTFELPEIPNPQVSFTGTYSKLEINGLELKDHRLLCVKCGADMLFPKESP